VSDSSSSLGRISFTVAGIPVQVTTAFWITSFLMGYGRFSTPSLLIEWVLITLVSVLVHELGHAIVARSFGQTVRIELHGLGGTAFHHGENKLKHWQEILISLAGPGAGVLLGALVFGLSYTDLPDTAVVGTAVADALWVNWGYGLLNLLPIRPLDGGHVMQAIVDIVCKRNSERIGAIISLTGVVALVVVVVVYQQIVVAYLLAFLAIQEGQRSMQVLREWQDDRLGHELELLDEALERQDGPYLIQAGQRLLPRAHSDRVIATLVRSTGWGFVLEKRYADALPVLEKMPSTYEMDMDLVGEIAKNLQQDDRLVSWLSVLWAKAPDGEVLCLLIDALLGTGEIDHALEVLQRASPGVVEPATVLSVDVKIFEAGRYEESVRLNQTWFHRHQSPTQAYNAACGLARLGRIDDAVQWLERSVNAGMTQPDEALDDEDLAPLRSHPQFAVLVERMRINADGAT